MSQDKGNQLLSHDAALDDYLGHLLTPDSESEPARPAQATVTSITPVVRLGVVRQNDDIPVVKPVEATKSTITPSASETQSKSLESEDITEPTVPSIVEETRTIPSGIVPGWAGETFACTQIMVDGIPLAFPTHAIKQVVDFKKDLRPVNQQPDWVMGLLIQDQGFIAVIDSARLFYQEAGRAASDSVYKKIITFGDGRWGLACDEVGQVISMSSIDVRWRTDNSRRQWLAGMLRHCALIDPDKLFEGL